MANVELNVKNYNEKVRKQRETFSRIDSTMAILEKLPDFVDSTLDFLNANSFTFSSSPLGFIFNLLKTLGVDDETLKEWIVEILVFVLPTVEIGVKASLLSNIKSLISCNADPRIPLRFRKKVSPTVYTNILTGHNENRGIDINVDAIDPNGILNLSPFTDPGKRYYFGCTKDSDFDSSIMKVESKYDDGLSIDTVTVVGDGNARTAKLVRANDFNAFLWYVIHKGNKQNPSSVKITKENGEYILTIDGDNENTYTIVGQTKSLTGAIEVKPNGKPFIIAGNTFYDVNNANSVSMCIETKVDDDGIVTGNTIVPISSDWYSCNWYVDKTNYYLSNIGIKKSKPRNYSEEKAICNLRYCEQYDYKGNIIPNSPHNIRFTILPKPYVLLPSLDEEYRSSDGEQNKVHLQWRPIRLLFDADGNPNQKGKFSLISETYDLQPTLTKTGNDGDYTHYDVRGLGEGGVHLVCAELIVNTKTGKYKLNPKPSSELSMTAALVECYPGLTVYEFNYDYIMGMKLFDPKVICQRLLENSVNPSFDAFFQLTLNKTKNIEEDAFINGKQQVIEIVKSILEEDEDEISDCFYTFSNEQYDEMLRKTEEIRYRQMPYNQGYNNGITVDFTEVNKILEKFPDKGSLESQKDIINQALTKACDILVDGKNSTLASDKSTVKKDFLTNALQQLVAAIVDAVLSPKVLMLLMVNRALMEAQPEEPLSTEALMKLLKNLVKSLVREVRDLIIKKLLDYILTYLAPLALQLQAKITSEQFAAYMAIIKLLLSWFNKGVESTDRLNSVMTSLLSRFKNKLGSNYEYGDISEIDLPSIIDNFTYADIYPNDIKDKEPINNNC